MMLLTIMIDDCDRRHSFLSCGMRSGGEDGEVKKEKRKRENEGDKVFLLRDSNPNLFRSYPHHH